MSDQPERFLRRAESHVANSASSVSNTGMRSSLMVAVSAFGNVVMKLKTSMATFGPFFLIDDDVTGGDGPWRILVD